MMRLNPTNEPRIRFEAFASGLQSWLSEHGAGLPSPAASPVSFKHADKENAGRAACQPLQLQALAAAQYPTNSPSKQSLRKVRPKPSASAQLRPQALRSVSL